MNSYCCTNGIFVKLMMKVWVRWDLKRIQGSTFDTIARNWWKIETLSLTAQARYRNYRMKSSAWMIREIFKMLNQYAVDNPTLPIDQCLSHPVRSWWNAKPSSGNAEPQQWAAKYLGHAWKIWKRLCKSWCVILSTLSTGVESLVLYFISTHISTWDEWKPNTSSGSEMSVRTVSQKVSRPKWGGFSQNYDADQRLQISDPHFDKFTTSPTFAGWKMRFKIEVCTCSQFSTEAVLWIKEVEMVESVDDSQMFMFFQKKLKDLILSYSMRGLLKHWTESSIILTSKEESVWRNIKPKESIASF